MSAEEASQGKAASRKCRGCRTASKWWPPAMSSEEAACTLRSQGTCNCLMTNTNYEQSYLHGSNGSNSMAQMRCVPPCRHGDAAASCGWPRAWPPHTSAEQRRRRLAAPRGMGRAHDRGIEGAVQ
eukprot:362568-Chlamydomonas_euryale.AAC.1